MTERSIERQFLDLDGRSWTIRELSADEARVAFPNELFFEDPPTVSLVFTSGDQRRYLAHAPAHWYDMSFTGLTRLLCKSARPGAAAQLEVESED